VVAGGYDVVSLPEIKYGLFSFWWMKWCPLMVFRYVDLILPISQNATRETLKNAKADPQKIRLIYLGFDTESFKPDAHLKKEPTAVTVGSVFKSNLQRKGLELFVRTSQLLPEVKFILVGRWVDDSINYLKSIAPSNVSFLNRLSDSELLKVLRKSKVYVQVSRHEGFGCSLAEAMLCECIPVVTKSAAIPEVVGDCGFFLTDQSPEKLAVLINKALNCDSGLGKKARERIEDVFPLAKRQSKLLELIKDLE